MITVDICLDLIEKEISYIELPENPELLYKPIRYVLQGGGKRFRPVITLLSCSLFSNDLSKALYPALSIELFHNFTLMHDDIMDKSEVRRNRPTVNSKWNNNIALLSGDALLIKAYEMLCKTEDPSLLKKLLFVFNETAIKVCEGQQLDMDFELRNDVTIDEYLEMIRLKTAVLIATSIKIGAMCGGADEQVTKKLYEFGENIGLAFQLQDDYLDVYGDKEVFGKKIGNDIITNKKTFLYVTAINHDNKSLVNELKYFFENSNIHEDEKIEKVVSIYNKMKLKEITENKIREFYSRAFSIFQSIPIIDKDQKNIFENYINKLALREK